MNLIPLPKHISLTGKTLTQPNPPVHLSEDPALSLGDEGYRLEITEREIRITGKTPRGTFYGQQTLRQLRHEHGDALPCLVIEDEPRFGWRGALLDVGRHFFPVEDIKKFLDLMALHKLNVFHWHLTEDQGWRIEIKSRPKLTEIGAWREKTRIISRTVKPGDDPEAFVHKHYGGFYTQEQIKELVAYAAERFITVVPEIEVPGHSSAAIAAYPELGNDDIPDYAPAVQCDWGVKPYTLSPKESTFAFLENVFREVMELFPSPFIHIGGDEAPKGQWKASPFAQEVIKREGLKDEDELQSWMLCRVEKFLNAHGRRIIGWDEINEGGMSPTATMMVWRDSNWARHAIERGNNVIMTPLSHCYLNYTQAEPPLDPTPAPYVGASGTTLEIVYAFEPTEGFTEQEAKHVLGLQGNHWAEQIPNLAQLEYQAFPRLCALAEVAWSPAEARNLTQFKERLEGHKTLLDTMNVQYFGRR